jgi:hypothetical protein
VASIFFSVGAGIFLPEEGYNHTAMKYSKRIDNTPVSKSAWMISCAQVANTGREAYTYPYYTRLVQIRISIIDQIELTLNTQNT